MRPVKPWQTLNNKPYFRHFAVVMKVRRCPVSTASAVQTLKYYFVLSIHSIIIIMRTLQCVLTKLQRINNPLTIRNNISILSFRYGLDDSAVYRLTFVGPQIKI